MVAELWCFHGDPGPAAASPGSLWVRPHRPQTLRLGFSRLDLSNHSWGGLRNVLVEQWKCRCPGHVTCPSRRQQVGTLRGLK